VTEGNPLKVFTQDWTCCTIQKISRGRRWLEGQRRCGTTRHTYRDKMAFIPGPGNGLFLSKIYRWGHLILKSHCDLCVEQKRHVSNCGIGASFGGFPEWPSRVQMSVLKGELVADEATHLVHDSQERAMQKNPNVVSIAAAGEFPPSSLYRDRPESRFHDEYRLRKGSPRKELHYCETWSSCLCGPATPSKSKTMLPSN
jgi:hypothetical protein